MIERLLETWLNKANERSFQIPFAHWLAYQGYTVLHVSRHCAMELGKDVIAIAPDGVPCAYQIKGLDGGKMTLAKWRDDIGKQVHPLVHTKIVHPSLNTTHHHRSYIVVNGEFNEEVQREIDDFNRASVDAGQPDRILNTIVKGELFQGFKDLQSDFWATNLYDVKTYLELYLDNGRGVLPKEKLARLLADALPFEPENGRRPANAASARALTGGAVICSAATSAFTLSENHVAEFEAWTLYWCHAIGLAERWNIGLRHIRFATDLASEVMYTSLGRLCDEMIERDDLVEGDLLLDRPVYRIRVTHLLGLLGLYGLLMQQRLHDGRSDVDRKHLAFAKTFCDSHKDKLWLWGEYAIPQFLALNFFRRTYDATPDPDFVYASLIKAICRKNRPGSEDALANAYYDAETILPHEFGLARKPLNDSFSGKSQFLEGLTHLFVRANFKQEMKGLFPDITRIGFRSFDPGDDWRFLMYRNWNHGTDVERYLEPPHRWSELRDEAAECDGKDVPVLLKDYPLQYLAMLMVMPYRANASGLRWLDTQLQEQAQDKSWLTEMS